MATAKARLLAAKKKELQDLEEEIKSTKNLAYKVLNSATEYKSSSGMTLKEMRTEVKKIHEVLNVTVEGDAKDPSISVFKEIINEKFSKQDELDQQVNELRKQISEYEEKIKQTKIPHLKQVNANSLPDVERFTKHQNKERDDLSNMMKIYKHELEMIKRNLDNFKSEINIMIDVLMKRFKSELESKKNEYKSKFEAQKNETKMLNSKKFELQKQLEELENSKKQYNGELEIDDELPDQKLVEKECKDIINQFYEVLKNAQKKLDTLENTSQKYKDFILELNTKIPLLEAQIARIIEKSKRLAAVIKGNQSKAGKITHEQKFTLMHCFMKSIFLYYKANEVTNGIEKTFAEEAMKIKKQVEIEESKRTNKIYEGMTLSDIRKEIIRLIKENASLNLEMEEENKAMSAANKELVAISKTS